MEGLTVTTTVMYIKPGCSTTSNHRKVSQVCLVFDTIYNFIKKVHLLIDPEYFIILIQDDVPEIAESFLVNITQVQLISEPDVDGIPSIRRPGNVAMVTIEENDDARGTVEFSVTRVR